MMLYFKILNHIITRITMLFFGGGCNNVSLMIQPWFHHSLGRNAIMPTLWYNFAFITVLVERNVKFVRRCLLYVYIAAILCWYIAMVAIQLAFISGIPHAYYTPWVLMRTVGVYTMVWFTVYLARGLLGSGIKFIISRHVE